MRNFLAGPMRAVINDIKAGPGSWLVTYWVIFLVFVGFMLVEGVKYTHHSVEAGVSELVELREAVDEMTREIQTIQNDVRKL